MAEEVVAATNDNTDVVSEMDTVGEALLDDYQAVEVEAPAEGTDDAAAPEGSVDEQAADQPVIPENYTLPEGNEEVTQQEIDYISDQAKQLGLDNENAAGLAKIWKDEKSSYLKGMGQALHVAEQNRYDKGNREVLSNIGQEAYDARLEGAKRAFALLENEPDAAGFINQIKRGKGNDPELIAAFNIVYNKALKEDRTNVGDINVEAPKPKSTADKIFG